MSTLRAVVARARDEVALEAAGGRRVRVLVLLSTDDTVHAPTLEYVSALPLEMPQVRVELWPTNELLFDVLAHELQPRYRALTPTERERHASDTLALLPVTDVAARWLGLAVGDLIVEQSDNPDVGRTALVLRVA